MSNQQKVLEFMTTFNQECPTTPAFPSDEVVKLRLEIIHEEFKELLEAVDKGCIVEAADALTDLLYVVYGTGIAFGIDLDKCFEEVQRSNMSKLGPSGPILREDGKILKGPDYSAPALEPILKKYKCGYCGMPCDERGITIIDNTEPVKGECCLAAAQYEERIERELVQELNT